MSTMMQNLAWLSAFACVLLGVHLLRTNVGKALPATLLGVTFLVLGLQSALMSLVLEYGHGPWRLFLPSSALLLGPLVFMYFASVADSDYCFSKVRCLHFVPAAVCLLEMALGIYWLDPDAMIVLSFVAYTGALMWRTAQGRSQFAHYGRHQHMIFLWLVSCLVMFGLSLINEAFILFELHQGRPIGRSWALFVGLSAKLVMLSFTVLSALQRPSPFDWLLLVGRKANQSEALSSAAYNKLAEEFNALVEHERLYTGASASLKDIAMRLSVPQRQLSQAINYVHGESFSKRMNRLRVEQAKRLLINSPNQSVVEIMLESGFRTKSNFNKEFLAIEGVSPSEFRKAVGG